MTAAGHSSREQARLWLAAFVVSAALNVLVILAFGLDVLSKIEFMPSRRSAEELEKEKKPSETVAMIFPEVVAPAPAVETKPSEVAPPSPPMTSSTSISPDQGSGSEKPEKPSFQGERNTTAASDLPPEKGAPAHMPNQAGEKPDNADEFDTTVSRFQQGDLFHDTIARQKIMEPREDLPDGPDAPAPMRTVAKPPPQAPAPAPSQDALVQGPFPVEREVRNANPQERPKVVDPAGPLHQDEEVKSEEIKEAPKPPEKEAAVAEVDRPGQDAPPTRTADPDRPGYREYKYKHRIHGSISREGPSALDVEESVMGRYRTALGRAVSSEWMRNCVRHRDYITPGQIIVRFVLESNGKVRSLQFVDEFGVGNIQKGFTLESIRAAEIPPFPAEMKKLLGDEPLEVSYSFTF